MTYLWEVERGVTARQSAFLPGHEPATTTAAKAALHLGLHVHDHRANHLAHGSVKSVLREACDVGRNVDTVQ